MLTSKQQELINLLKGVLPTAPAKVAQEYVSWYPKWKSGEALELDDRVAHEGILYRVRADVGENIIPPDKATESFVKVEEES